MTQPTLKLAAFDMDGTVLEEDSSWVAVHKHFGTTEPAKASLKLYTEGKIDYKEFMRRDISSWPKGVTRSELESVLSNYKIRREAPQVIRALKERRVDPALITSGIDMLAERVARDLGIEHVLSNRLAFDAEGKLVKGVGVVDPLRKDRAYLGLLARLGIKGDETIAVGDTIYDLAFLKSARMGFMLAHSTRVDDPDIVHITNLSEILAYI